MNRHEKQEVEQGLRNLLEEVQELNILNQMMIFCNEKINGIENWNCLDLIQRITKLSRQLRNSNLEYKKLESVLQQQEADIRNHISVWRHFQFQLEQQMKLYQDGLQSKLEEANQEIKRLSEGLYKLKKSNCQSESMKKDQSNDGSTSQKQGSPKKLSSFSQHGGYTSHRSSCDELFKRYNKLLQQQQACINQRSNNIQISQYMMKGRQTLAEICNIQQNRKWIKQFNQFRNNKKFIENEMNYKMLKL
ncbi:unnamed protein product (macronuclear) [Paramecium tetraurelia]|uniref:Uncharacterized protein n=1 Tax=Paramecium tetraurelia TaxID=5888 RepID=A0DSA3_PARTE|nr:uncharacterized protein GSPATT00019624001 [Paramecium tetraurelia]CAK85920.1 unnamed protein product [Paramecium tetraurelia]|eukprot:XP_001453317.1 hypothetical protein (macronuclear) [Paramecium tetraurelia strain d4-2]